MNQPELGRKIAELRKAKGLTQEELVEECNISVRTIQRIESGDVTPRSYTIKSILGVLGEDLKSVEEKPEPESEASAWKSYIATDTDTLTAAPGLTRNLTIAWVCGLAYFVLGFIESYLDGSRMAGGMEIAAPGYILVKLMVLVTVLFFMRGFLITGSLYNNYLLKVSSFMFIGYYLLIIGYDVFSVFYDPLEYDLFMLTSAIGLGAIGMVFAAGLFKLNRKLGAIALAAGGAQLLAAVCFISVVLSPVGMFLLVPAELACIMLLYKVVERHRQKEETALAK